MHKLQIKETHNKIKSLLVNDKSDQTGDTEKCLFFLNFKSSLLVIRHFSMNTINRNKVGMYVHLLNRVRTFKCAYTKPRKD